MTSSIMPFGTLAFIAVLIADPALSRENCSRWQAAIDETEGGEEMTARICTSAGDRLYVQCGAHTEFAMRFETSDLDFPPGGPGYEGDFLLTVGDDRFEVRMIYEAMDGALAYIFPSGSAFRKTLSSGESLTISSKVNDLPETTFTLTGSAAALAEVEKACRRR